MSPVDHENLLLQLLKKASNESIISFTAGFPAQELLPLTDLRKSYDAILQDSSSLQYSTDPKGDRSLREQVSEILKKKQINADCDDILITSGSSQAIDLITRVFVQKGDVVLVENPTYQEVLKMLHQQGIETVGVQSDWDGMVLSDLEEKIVTYRPKMVYVNPTFGNPNGKVWSTERRKELIKLCEASDVLILEDDPYGDLKFEQAMHIPTLYELDQESGHANVLYVSTFSKIIAPAVRVGYVVSNANVLHTLSHMQHLSVLHAGIVDQRAIAFYLQNHNLNERLIRLTKEYQSRASEMIEELTVQFEGNVHWHTPTGGIYLWLELSQHIPSMQLLEKAIANGVFYFPGQFFYVKEPDVNGIRLNFTFPSKTNIRSGIKKLAKTYYEFNS